MPSQHCPVRASLHDHETAQRFEEEANDQADRIVADVGDGPDVNDDAYTAEDVSELREWLESVHHEATAWADEYVSDHFAEAVECRVLGRLDERISWAEELIEEGPNACEAAARGTAGRFHGFAVCEPARDRVYPRHELRGASAFGPRGAFALAMTRWHLARIGGAA